MQLHHYAQTGLTDINSKIIGHLDSRIEQLKMVPYRLAPRQGKVQEPDTTKQTPAADSCTMGGNSEE